ncbi:glycosyltransferase, partial [Alphaproteobacteria bacterium]|nr:glycosyltransferase [Alphaproteobacteria bacterium]
MNILYLTPVFEASEILCRLAVSPAANKWQSSLVKALSELTPQVKTYGHLPEPFWPKGQLFPKLDSKGHSFNQMCLAPYVNVPLLRGLTLKIAYKMFLNSLLYDSKSDIVLVTYNPPGWLQDLLIKYTSSKQFSWVSIVADGGAPSKADGLVFLSYGYYKSYPIVDAKKMHLDGALYQNLVSGDVQKKGSRIVLMYSGTSSKWGGVSYLLEAYLKLCQKVDVELWISGAGDYSQFSKQYSHEPSIKFFGMLSESELEERYKQADIFINPRPELYDNDKNFPSKLFDYISYGKPVISFKTSGLSHQYDGLLIFPTENSVEALANSIEKVMNWTDSERQFYASN